MKREGLEFVFCKEIERIITTGKQIIIYPFGAQGLVCLPDLCGSVALVKN